jgi:hypothetical protein
MQGLQYKIWLKWGEEFLNYEMTLHKSPLGVIISKTERLAERVPFLSTTFVRKSFAPINIYWVTLRKAYRSQNVRYCPIITKIKKYRNILVEVLNIRFHENLFSSSEVVTCRQTDVVKLIGTFSQLFIANGLKEAVSLLNIHDAYAIWFSSHVQ